MRSLALLVCLLAAFAAVAMELATDPAARTAPRRPPALRPGDRIALVAPAGPLSDAAVRAAIRAVEAAGYRPVPWLPDRPQRGYLAADDAARLTMLNGAIRDPEVRAILCLRGGYGTPRILDGIDYAHFREHPKILIGYSDITALLLAVRRETNSVVFHGPLGKELGESSSGLSPFTARYFWGAFRPEPELFSDWGKLPERPPRRIAGGTAEGTLTGGNLSMVCATMGTRWDIDTEDAILFLEDVNEKAFRIDRMLAQLRLAGKLGTVRGVLLGSFTGCGADPQPALTVNEVFADYFADLGVPVLADYPAGHGLRDHAVLPFGVRVRLDADRGTLSLLESPVAR